MKAQNINLVTGCEECRFADRSGRGCKYSLMRPVILKISGKECELKQPKNEEQLKEQIQ